MAAPPSAEWDYIVVGGGSAGCAIAHRLSASARRRVLLLEAGRSDSHPFSRIPAAIGLAISHPGMNWQFLAEPDPSRANRVDMWPAGRMLGGGSAINGMMFVRGNRWDYDHWAALGNPGWSYADVLPYFKRLEHNERGADEYRGTGGPLWVSDDRVRHPLSDSFVEAMVELGVSRNPDLNGRSQDGVDYCQVSQRNGWRHSTAQAYIRPVRRRTNLTVELGACARMIELSNGRATAIHYEQDGKAKNARAACGIVLSAGALSSPALLMRSGIGPPDHLRALGIDVHHELPGVGKNLQEHPGLILSAHVRIPTLTSDTGPLRSLMHGWNYLTSGRGPLTNPVGHAHAFIRTRPAIEAPNVQMIFSPLSFDHHERGATPYKRPAVNFAIGLCRVASRGEVALRSADPDDPPLIKYALLSEPDDVRQIAEGARFARQIYRTEAFGEYFVDERKPGEKVSTDVALEKSIREGSFLMYHPCGTCRMGPDAQAVVDGKLRVHGLDGLWVADASVIPTIPAGNINATVIMIGEKAADLVLERSNG